MMLKLEQDYKFDLEWYECDSCGEQSDPYMIGMARDLSAFAKCDWCGE